MGLAGQEAFLIAVNMLMKKPSNGIQPTIALGAQVMVPIVWRCVNGVMPVVFMVLTAGHPVSSSSWMVKEWVPYLWNRRLGRCGEWMEKHGVQAESFLPRWKMLYIIYQIFYSYTVIHIGIHIYIYVRIYFHNGTEKKERNRTYKTIQIDFHQTARFTTCNMYITTVYIASIQIDKPFLYKIQ